jgi:zinc protease
MDRLKAQMNVTGNATSATANIETVEANLPGALRLAAEILREPAFPDSEFETVRQQRIAGAEAGRSDPQALAVNNFQHRMSLSARRSTACLHRRRADRRPQESHA